MSPSRVPGRPWGSAPAAPSPVPPRDLVGREGDAAATTRKPRTKRPDQDRRETGPRITDQASGGQAHQAPGPASPAGGQEEQAARAEEEEEEDLWTKPSYSLDTPSARRVKQ